VFSVEQFIVRKEYGMQHIIVHEGPNIALAVMQVDYAPLYTHTINNPTVVEGVTALPPITEADEVEWITSLSKKKGTDSVFAVLVKTNNEYLFIGAMGLHKISWQHGTADSGSLLGDTSKLGRGYGTEAKLLLLKRLRHAWSP
jgi:RimJ/RimL family protein N-acetyltransferase